VRPALSVAGRQGAGGYDAIYIDQSNMYPEVPRGSIAFLDPAGFRGVEGIYSVPHDGSHLDGNLRRICCWAAAISFASTIGPSTDRATSCSVEMT